jgi:hypothetical protein
MVKKSKIAGDFIHQFLPVIKEGCVKIRCFEQVARIKAEDLYSGVE